MLHEDKIAEGRSELKKVLAAEPENANANYEYGKAELTAGHLDSAIEHLEKAAKGSPEKSYIHYQLGRAYQQAGQPSNAEREFAKVKTLRGMPQ